jgi:ATP-dependent DNA helicase RecG
METQNIEWKESWRDEYLKWVCGFANAQGGRLEIGRNDSGALIGLQDAKRLLVELPNKIRTTMGIVAGVNLLCEDGFEYIVIDVAAHPNAINYRGKYYMRSGSTNQELTGFALDSLLLGKYGKTWDSVPVPYIKAENFYHDAFDVFRKKAVASKRLLPEDVECSDAELLNALRLTEGDYLLRAAPLLFHHDPENWCLGSYVKIGYFENDADLLYQDEISGPLILLPDRVMDTIFTKYFKGLIRYEGIQRIDEYPMPRDVLREAVLNAVVHKDYSTCNPIHIRVYDDKVIIYNDCRFPLNMQPEVLLQGIGSKPHNPLIANVFFRSGQVEAWGRGIEKMKNGCIADSLPEPDFKVLPTTFSVCFHIRNNNKVTEGKVVEEGINVISIGISSDDSKIMKSGMKSCAKSTVDNILELINNDSSISISNISKELNISRSAIQKHIENLKTKGIIERVGTDKGGYWKIRA